jgi:putative nucleotidyltransferase with HDIG domain
MRRMARRSVLWIFGAILIVILTLILSFNLVRGPQIAVTLGEPSPKEVISPESINYISDVRTERATQAAEDSVHDQYTTIDLSIARAQNNLARAVFNYINVVREDTIADEETKMGYLFAVEDVTIDREVGDILLTLSDADYEAAVDNTLQIVEDDMRAGVVENQLEAARNQAAQRADFDLSLAQEQIVAALAPQFIVPNIFLDQEATDELTRTALETVEPIVQRITEDERIIRVGEIVTEEHLEMLEKLGLLQPTLDWKRLVSTFLVSILAVTIITLYWRQYFFGRRNQVRDLTILGSLMVFFVLGAKLLVPTSSIFAYLFPAAALSILVAVVFETRLAILVTIVVAGLIGYLAPDSLEMAFYAAVGGILAVLTLHDPQRINALFRVGLLAALGNIAVILIFRLPTDIETAELMTLLLFGVLNGPLLSAGLSIAGIFIIGTVFRVVTPLQLQELSRLDHPLLQELLRRAPGTYHHSIMVANLAEQAAEKIKANSTLVRVGAFYHDIGKVNRPPFFIENQNGGNPHDNLDPYSSARIIMSHVPDGLEMAKRYRLPRRIRDFIAEHHGDRVVQVFYQKAKDLADEGEVVDISRFMYPGPRPQSRESGIVQLADSIDAASNALRPNTEEAIDQLVNMIVDDHVAEGQLDNSGLSLGDIKKLRSSFTETLHGRFHMRIRYPGNDEIDLVEPEDAEEPVPEIDSEIEEPVPDTMLEEEEPGLERNLDSEKPDTDIYPEAEDTAPNFNQESDEPVGDAAYDVQEPDRESEHGDETISEEPDPQELDEPV